MRTIKIFSGMTEEYEILRTDAPADSGSFQTFQMMRSRLKLFQMALSLIVIF